ncbi:MAG: hypothetical protein AAFO04_30005, partial [Cyanobacteria bacterium J06592_8]
SNSPISGTGNNFTLNAENGNISLDTVGQDGNEIGEISLETPNTINLLGDIFTNGDLDFSTANQVNIAGSSVTLQTQTGNGEINLSGVPIDGTESGNQLILNAGSGNITLNSIGENIPLNALEIDTSGQVNLGGNINIEGVGGVSFENASNIILTDNVIINTALGNGEINFNTATINGESRLQLNSGEGNISLGTVGDNQPLSSLSVNSQGETNLSGNITTRGLDGVNFGNGSTLLLTENINIDTSLGNGQINLGNSSIDGNFDLELNSGSGEINLGTVGSNTPVNSLSVTTTGLTTLNDNLTTENNLDFSQATGGTQLNTDVNLTSNTGNIDLSNSPISGTGNRLTLQTPGEISLNNIGGNNNELAGVTINDASIVNLFGDIYTDGGINVPNVTTINLSRETIILETDSDNGEVNLADTSVEGQGNLFINAGSGEINLGNVGNSIPLDSITINTSGLTSLNGNLTTNNDINFTEATGGTQLNSDVNMTSNVGNIDLSNSPISGTGNRLTLQTPGEI